MGDVGAPELLIILAVILLLFGGKKLPEFARSLGKAKNEFQKGVEEGMPASGDEAHVVPPTPVPPPAVTPQAESTPDVEQSTQPEPPA
jgi:sec-independent protein translocase protein TatA